MLIAVPDVVAISRDPEQDEFVFLGCDGIFENLSTEAVCDLVIEQLGTPGGKSLGDVCNAVRSACVWDRSCASHADR
jgi:serine/threonine protein phosphatase PrpC